MIKIYSKNVCWELSTNTWKIKDDTKDCKKLSKNEKISSTLKIAGFDAQSFDIKFETPI